MKLISTILVFSFCNLISPAYSNWNFQIDENPMDSSKSVYLFTSEVNSKPKMKFPYSNTRASLVFACSNFKNWSFFTFNESPLLNNKRIKSGYDEITTRIKFGNNFENIDLNHEWGQTVLHVDNDILFRSSLSGNLELLLELDWYGEGKVYFKFDTSDYLQKIKELNKKCKL